METIKALLELQDIDGQILIIESMLQENIPSEKKLVLEKQKEVSEKLERARAQLKEKELEQKKLESEIAAKEALLTKQRTQQAQVKKTDEYEALNTSISEIEVAISNLEDRELNLMEAIDSDKATLQEVEKEAADTTESLKKELELVEKRKTSLESDLESLKKQSSENKTTFSSEWIDAYTYAKQQAKKPPFVVTLEDERCQGCHIKVPSGKKQLAKGLINPCHCDTCGRILYAE